METIVSTGPIHCHIEPTRRCNLNCVMCCPHELRHAHRPDMGFDLFRKVVDDESFTKNLHPEKCRECPNMRSANVDSISRHFTPEKRRELADIDPAFRPIGAAETLSPVNS